VHVDDLHALAADHRFATAALGSRGPRGQQIAADEWNRPSWLADIVNGVWTDSTGFISQADQRDLAARAQRLSDADQAGPDDF